MNGMEWVDLAERLIDKGEWSKALQRKFVAAVRLAELRIIEAEGMLNHLVRPPVYTPTGRRALGVKTRLVEALARLRSGEVEEKP